ncbi:MAG: VCBS repeat-containing protein [Chitinophagaceae bacterium]|nr:VCBS repeat-containing protein [Chitinophagaceae bacterium]
MTARKVGAIIMDASIIKFFLVIAIVVIAGCMQKVKSGKQLAKTYCSNCHLFPEPSLLDKITWKNNVLPAMGKLLGAQQLDLHPFEESDRIISHQEFSISAEDWKQLVKYYTDEAPAKLPPQSRSPITNLTDWFIVEKKSIREFPTTTFLKIDPGNKWIYAAGRDSVLEIFDHRLNKVSNNFSSGILSDMFFTSDLKNPGDRKGVCTNIGIMDPNDLKTGSVSVFTIGSNGKLLAKNLFDTLARPVQTISSDLNADNVADYLLCNFGNKDGNFSWMQNIGNEQYIQKILEPLPGSIRAYVEDMDHDGLQDIIVLFSQANEGIRLYLNKGGGKFSRIELLRFPPVYGSTYFEMVDLNSDGNKDILYTCGDNADYSNILKNYHGIYFFLNMGGYRFEKAYFFPMHGAFKAMARDFNKDGKLDIAAISFFPDRKNQPQEAFVLLEGREGFEFLPHTIKEHSEGHWLTMDAADVDADGDDDIVIGNLVLPNGIGNKKGERIPTFLLLRNNKN